MSNFEIIMLTMLIGYRNGYTDGHELGFKRGRASSRHASVKS